MRCVRIKHLITRGGHFSERLFFPLIIALTVGYCLQSMDYGVDFWAHAAVGRWMVEHRQISHSTLFLWSADIPWAWHAWLSQIIFYGVMGHVKQNIGALFAILMTTALSVPSLLIWWKVWLKNQRKYSVMRDGIQLNKAISWPMLIIFFIAIYAAHDRFHPRPEIVSALFLSLLLYALIRGFNSWKALAAIFAFFVLWTNLHGGVAMGIVFLWITTICDFIQDRDWKRSRWMLGASILAVLALFVNPYGWHYLRTLSDVGGTTFSYIDEWKPFWHFPALPNGVTVTAGLCALVGLIAWIGSDRKRLSHLVWLLMLSAMFLMARRHVWTLAQITLAVVAVNPRIYCSKSWMFPRKGMLSIAAAIVLFGFVLGAPSPGIWRGEFADARLPRKAMKFIKLMPPGYRLFNTYSMSSYLEWELYGDPPLFIDLLNAYPTEIMRDYNAIMEGSYRTKALLENYGCDTIIIPQPQTNANARLLSRWLFANYPWGAIYADEAVAIWQKMPVPDAPETDNPADKQ